MHSQRRPPPIHPGEFLREDYLPELSLSVEELAGQSHVAPSELVEVFAEQRGLSCDLAYRLALYFETSSQFWMNTQTSYELNTIYNSRLDQMRREAHPRKAA